MLSRKDISLKQTCGACPEQYDVYIGEVKVGYLRLRHGHFYAQVPGPGGKTVYETSDVMGDGIFEPDEREYYLNMATDAVFTEIYKRVMLNKYVNYIER